MPNVDRLVTLEPNSVYIATQPLVSGQFHWSLLVTNGQNEAFRHQWHEDPTSPYFAERYSIQPYARPLLENSTYLGYFKVLGCTLPGNMFVGGYGGGAGGGGERTSIASSSNGSLIQTPSPRSSICEGGEGGRAMTFVDICDNTFPTHYRTVEQNRAHGISCRTWVFRVLAALWGRGFVVGRAPKEVGPGLKGIEEVITKRSQVLEKAYLQAFLFQTKYTTVVEDV